MPQLQQASIFKFTKKNKFLIHSLSKIEMGGSIASAPFIWIVGDDSLNKVAEQLKYVLSKSETGLPNPLNWGESAKNFLKNIGLKKHSDLYKNTLHVGVLKKGNIIYFTPMKNLGSEGFINVTAPEITINENCIIEEIAHALQGAFDKCE